MLSSTGRFEVVKRTERHVVSYFVLDVYGANEGW